MQPTSDLYKAILQNQNHAKEIKLNIAGVEYGMGDIVSCSTSGGIFSQPGIGNCTARQIQLEIFPLEEIPRQAQIQIFVRLVLSEQISEWIPKGVFFISTREKNKLTGSLKITGYDAMLKTEQTWLTADYATDMWPMSQSDAVADIASRIGVEIDSRTVLSADYPVEYPTGENGDLTMREVLGYIAVSNAGNWSITDEGKLRLIGYADTPAEDDEEATNKTNLGNNVSSLDYGEKVARISRINLVVDSENMYTAGDDTGRTLEVACSWGTQAMANSILAKVSGVDYQPYAAADALLDPAAEIGDGVSIADIYSVIATSAITLDKMCEADISAPYTDEIDDEYPYKTPEQRRAERQLAQTRSEITKTAEEINLKIEATDGRVSNISQTVDGITLSVTSSSSTDGQTTAKITLKVGPNSYTGYIKLDGNVDVSGQLSADALYAALGDIADLTVDRLSTSRRIVKYLAGDKSDDNYIRIHDQYLEFVSGVYANGTEQASNPHGALLYWEANPEGASIGSDGYPYVDGERIFTTTTETNWPVMVYTYTEQVKRSIAFESNGDQYVPVDVFGAGNADGTNQARMLKSTEGLELTYVAPNGLQAGLKAGTSGYLDLYGLRRVVGLNFAGWDSGSWRVRLEGVTDALTYGVTLDDSGAPAKITYPDGTECPIYWTEAAE